MLAQQALQDIDMSLFCVGYFFLLLILEVKTMPFFLGGMILIAVKDPFNWACQDQIGFPFPVSWLTCEGLFLVFMFGCLFPFA